MMMKNYTDWLFYGMIIAIVTFAILMAVQMVFAEELYGNNTSTGIFVAYDGNLSMIVYKSAQGTSTHYDATVKEFKHGGFLLKSPEIVIFGHPLYQDKYTVLVMTSNGFERFVVSEYHPPIKVEEEEMEAEKISSGILEEYWKNKENTVVRDADKKKEIIVAEQPKQEIVIVSQMANQVPWMSNYSIDLKVYDPEINKKLDYYWKDGRIAEVEITGKVIDPNGKILKSFSGVTSQFGYFSESVYIPANSNTNKPFTLEILASKYFDDSLATFSFLQQFSVYAPGIGSGGFKCPNNEILNSTGFCVTK